MNITNKLGISRQDFIELYPDADHDIFFRDPKTDVEFMERYLTNKLWRLNNLYTITDKFGEIRPFIMNRSQHVVYQKSLIHSRILILKSRQQGISTFWLISFFDDSIFTEYLDIGLMSQGRQESGTLLTRTKLAWDKLDGTIKSFLAISVKKDNADEIGLSNKSTIFIRTSFRSATLQRLHISEYGKICNKYPERAKETKTGTLQAIAPGNTVVIESTAEGHNDFKEMWDKHFGKRVKDLGPKEFLCVFLSWLDDPDCVSTVHRKLTPEQQAYFEKAEFELNIYITQEQKNFWVDQYNELEEKNAASSAIYQEYPMTPDEAFKALRDGTYYAELYSRHVMGKGRRVSNLYDPNLEVEVCIDLGINDEFVLGFFQKWQGEDRCIHEYKNSSEGIKHYCDYMFARDEDGEPIVGHPCTGFTYGVTYLPWDADVRELGTGLKRKDIFYENGVTNYYVLPKLPITTGISLVRKLILNTWIDEKCEYIHSCFLNYSKEWEERVQNWKDKPLHDSFSHGMDMYRYRAMSLTRDDVTLHSAKTSKKRRTGGVVDGLSI